MAGLAYPHWEPSPFHTPATEQFQRRRRCLRPSGPSFQLSPRPLSPPAFASRQPPIQAQQYLSLTACRWADAACPRLEQNDNTRPSRGHLHVVPEVTHLLISCAPFQNPLFVEEKKCALNATIRHCTLQAQGLKGVAVFGQGCVQVPDIFFHGLQSALPGRFYATLPSPGPVFVCACGYAKVILMSLDCNPKFRRLNREQHVGV